MRGTITAIVAVSLLVGLTPAVAANPAVTVPTQNANNVVDGAEAVNASIRDAATAFAGSIEENATDAATTEIANGRVPADQLANVTASAVEANQTVVDAASGFAVLVVGEGATVANTKVAEGSAIFVAGVGVGNTAILAAGGIAKGAANAACTSPLRPPSAPSCDAGSIIDAATGEALDVTDSAQKFGTAVPGHLETTECAAQTAATGLVDPGQDPGLCP